MQKWLIILPQKGDTRRLALAAPKPDCEVTEFSWRAFVNNAGGMSVMWRGGQGGGEQMTAVSGREQQVPFIIVTQESCQTRQVGDADGGGRAFVRHKDK